MTMVCFMFFDMRSSMMRATTSLALPPANGMMTVISLIG